MDKIDMIYLRLCLKYGFNNIVIRKKFTTLYDAAKQDDGSFSTVLENPQYRVSGVSFINMKTGKEIDLKQEFGGQ